MLLKILSILANIAYTVVLRLKLYTDKAMMPDGELHKWRRSPIDRLDMAGHSGLAYAQLFLAAVSVVSAALLLFGVKGRALRAVWLASTAASTLLFLILMLVTGGIHAAY